MEQIKIKIYGFANVNRKQFFWVYGIISTIFLLLTLYFFFYPNEVQPTDSKTAVFFKQYTVVIFLLSFLGAIMEGQFYWTKFVRKQMDIILEQKTEIEQQKEEITAQRDEIEQQKFAVVSQNEEIEKQRTHIMDSIYYAKRIQKSVLKSDRFELPGMPPHFIFFKPKDIVSGDFYWAKSFGSKILLTAADCTGHGVPGAFMSMLGTAALNDVAHSQQKPEPAEVLNRLRNYITETLESDQAKDGMDMALALIDTEEQLVTFAGANSPAFWVVNGVLTEYKASKMPVGYMLKNPKPFTQTTFSTKEGGMLYLFSDGFMDQFGGEKSRKYLKSNFKNLLIRISELPIDKQKTALYNELQTWMLNHEQVDDMLIIGLQFNTNA